MVRPDQYVRLSLTSGNQPPLSISHTAKKCCWTTLFEYARVAVQVKRTGHRPNATKGPAMSQTVCSQRVAAPPIRTLIIRADNTYEIREIEQDLKTLQGIVGGYVEDIPTQHCVLWRDEESMLKDYSDNTLATYLWWNLWPPDGGPGRTPGHRVCHRERGRGGRVAGARRCHRILRADAGDLRGIQAPGRGRVSCASCAITPPWHSWHN
jgi:Domain of unknown function (DUF3846)